jgi:hypothetical protein
MDFDINLYTPTDPNKVPAGFKSREEEAFTNCAADFLSCVPNFQAQAQETGTIINNIVSLVKNRRPHGYFYIKLSKSTETAQDEGYADFCALFSNVLARHPLFAAINTFETAQTAQGFADQITEATSASESTNDSTTDEKYNPINSEYSKLGGRVEGKAEATATNAGKTTTKKTGDEVERILKEFRPVIIDIVNEICAVYVYSAEEIAEAYYLDNADECEG